MQEIYAEDILKEYTKLPTAEKPVEEKVGSDVVFAEDLLREYNKNPTNPNELLNKTPEHMEQTLSDRVEGILKKRGENISTVYQDMISDKKRGSLFKTDFSDLAQTALGQGAGAFMDVSSEIVMEGITAIIPDDVEDSIKQSFVDGLNYLATKPVMNEIAQFAGGKIEEYVKWKEDNPVAALKAESAINLAAFFAPPATRRTMSPASLPEEPAITKIGEQAATQVDKVSTVLKQAATKQVNKQKQAKAYELVMPVHLKEDRLKDMTKRSFFKDAKLEPNQIEAEAIQYVSELNIAPSKGFKHNWDVINKAKNTQAQALRGVLAVHRNKTIPKEITKSRVQAVAADMLANTPELVGEPAKVFERVMKQLDSLVDSHGTTPNDILTLRQDFDSFLNKNMKFFEKEQIAGFDVAVRTVRRELNNIVNDVVGDDTVKKMLRKEELAFTALKGISPKAVKEIDRQASVLYKNLSRVLGDEMRTTRILGYTALGSGFSAAMGVLPYITGGAFAVGLGAMAVKGAVSPQAKKGLAVTLEEISKAIKITTNPKMAKELRAGRSMVLEMLKLPVEAEEQQGDKKAQ